MYPPPWRLAAITLAALLGVICWAPASSADPRLLSEDDQTRLELSQTALKSFGADTGLPEGRTGVQNRRHVEAPREFDALTREQQRTLIQEATLADLAQSKEPTGMSAREQEPESTAPTEGSESPASPEGRQIDARKTSVESFDQRLAKTVEGIKGNSKAVADLGGLLDAEIEKLDEITLRLGAVDAGLKQSNDVLKNQKSWLEDNSTKLYEALVGIDGAQENLTLMRRDLDQLRSAYAETDTPVSTTDANGDRFSLLLPLLLCLLVPLAMVVYQGGLFSAAAGSTTEATHVAWILVAWFTGGAAFFLIGIGVMYGPSLGGVIGDPRHFMSTVMLSAPADLSPALLERLMPNLVLASVVAAVACSSVPTVITNRGLFLVAVVAGGLIHPLFGHWIALPTDIADQSGWLAGSALAGPAVTTYMALLGGILALSLASGLGLIHARSDASSPGPIPGSQTTTGAMLLWIAWIGVILIANADDLPLTGLSISLAGTSGGAAFGALLVGGTTFPTYQWQHRLPFAVLAGIVATPIDAQGATLVELAAIGALAGVSTSLLIRFFDTRSTTDIRLASSLLVGGIFGSLGPVIFGPAGLLFVHSVGALAPQLQGMGVALVLGIVAGRILAWPIGTPRFLRTPT